MAHAGHEILLTTDDVAAPWCLSAWDTDKGSSLSHFKGQAIAPHCLCLRDKHTLVGASESKPILQLWPLSKKEDQQQKLVCPGKVSSVAISPDGLFCIAAIAEKVYIWELSTGSLLSVLSDFDEVKVVKFTDDGSQFATGAVGGTLSFWDFGSAVSRSAPQTKGCRPRHRKQAHSAEVTDVHIGCGGPAARVFSCSADFSCKVWGLMSGELMKSIIYEEEVHSVMADQAEMLVYAGLQSGDIRCTPLYGQVSQPEEYSVKNVTKAGERTFHGHLDRVTCLAISRDGLMLASGSADGTARLWSIHEENSLLKIQHAGPVTNILLLPKHILSSGAVSLGPAITLQTQKAKDQGSGRVFNLLITDSSEWPEKDQLAELDRLLGSASTSEPGAKATGVKADTGDEVTALRQEVEQLRQVNKDLYNFMAKKIISNDGGKAAGD